MSRDVSDNFKRESFRAQTDEAFIILLTLDHADLAEPIRVTPDPMELLESGIRGVVSNGVSYAALPFEIVLPGDEEDNTPVVRVRIDNISREILAAARSITSPPAATIAVVLASDPDVEEISITGFELNNIRADVFTVEGELTTARLELEPFPSGRFTPALFPGLH